MIPTYKELKAANRREWAKDSIEDRARQRDWRSGIRIAEVVTLLTSCINQ
jgi:hypothetical protein